MGIWNRRSATRRDGAPRPHYPSWGFGTRAASAIFLSAFLVSLPLMGIWNSWRTLEMTVRPRLITPHGDLEPVRTGASDTRIFLITPHGDLERAIPTGEMDRNETSLPLMGIWNPEGARGRSRSARTHYPSWGFGTGGAQDGPIRALQLITPHGDLERCCWSISTRPTNPHYPSWGFGTVGVLDDDGQVDPLITPHGDLEHGVRVRRSVCHTASLPLMGIWNASAAASRAASSVSLPLMGIWNALRARRVEALCELITPHGDLEPDLHAAREAPHRFAHYPSWGFGTGVVSAMPQGLRLSLPLMGIWNQASLPLRKPFLQLITPHGDLEPPAPDRS